MKSYQLIALAQSPQPSALEQSPQLITLAQLSAPAQPSPPAPAPYQPYKYVGIKQITNVILLNTTQPLKNVFLGKLITLNSLMPFPSQSNPQPQNICVDRLCDDLLEKFNFTDFKQRFNSTSGIDTKFFNKGITTTLNPFYQSVVVEKNPNLLNIPYMNLGNSVTTLMNKIIDSKSLGGYKNPNPVINILPVREDHITCRDYIKNELKNIGRLVNDKTTVNTIINHLNDNEASLKGINGEITSANVYLHTVNACIGSSTTTLQCPALYADIIDSTITSMNTCLTAYGDTAN
jgi:hypothetical protein